MPPLELSIRAAEPEDIDFIMSSWKRSWRVSPWAGCIRNDRYYADIASTIEGLVGRGASFLIASAGGRILGWVCSEVLPDGACCVHYLYVKDPYIPLSIGDKLVAATAGTKPGFYTFRYRQVSEACTREAGWCHRPEIARRRG